MNMLLVALAILGIGGLAALLIHRNPKFANGIGSGSAVFGSLLGLMAAILLLFSSPPSETIRLPWSVPYGTFYIEADALSAFFLIPIFLLTGLAALYGARYLWEPKNEKRIGSHWAFYNTLAVSMVMVVIARNAILFLISWEVMALASFFLVTMEDERESVQRAGWIYLVSTHLGTMVLFFFFILIGNQASSLDFDRFVIAGSQIHPQASLFFVLALIGFGSKAGILPLHIWLPEAHPAAPSHVSALMSGVMIKTGIYGIIRALTWLGPPTTGWALTLIVIGSISGVMGVLLALAQHDLKRLLAYHSVENIGIIFLGLGIGLLGQANDLPVLILLGYGGALLHTLNHAIFKGLLFLGAGSVLHGTGTLDIEHTGGLMKRMPWTGALFLVGAVAICGLPPLNGFVSEFMIFAGAFQGIQYLNALSTIPGIIAIVALAMIGGLAVACFTKAFGIIFLGKPRSSHAAEAHESKPAMLIPMIVLAGLCVVIGLAAPYTLTLLKPALNTLSTNVAPTDFVKLTNQIQFPLTYVVVLSALFAVLVALLFWLRKWSLSGKSIATTVTWDCGYAKPTARMQYTASSFAQPLMKLASGVVRLREHLVKPEGFFPSEGSYSSKSPDVVHEGFWTPTLKASEWFLLRFRWIQMGSIHLYILYIAITLFVLLIWKLQ